MITVELIDCQNSLRNYVFLITNTLNSECALVDCVDTPVVTDYLADKGLDLKYMLYTHHHHDHIGGAAVLKERFPLVEFIAHSKDRHRIPHATQYIEKNQEIQLFDQSFCLQIIPLDGHTIGHIGYYVPEENWFFAGDAVFNLGCGKLFEGTAEDYLESFKRIKQLKDETVIFGTHEYTLGNIDFARSVIPQNYEYYDDFLEYCTKQHQLRRNKQPTVPFTLQSQKRFNPFFLTDNICLKKALGLEALSESAVMGHLRSLKDHFHA